MKKLSILSILLVSGSLALAQSSAPKPGAEGLFQQGQAAKKANDLTAASAAFRKSIELDPSYAPAHAAFMSAIEDAETSKAFNSATPGSKDFSRALYAAREIAVQKLVPIYTEWLRKYPNVAAVQWGVSRVHREDYDKSRPHLLKAVELDPKLCQAWNDLGRQSLLSSDFGKARDYFKQAYDCEPGSWQYGEAYLEALRPLDMTAYRAAVDEYIRHFPNEAYAPRALTSLAGVLDNLDEKIAVLERLRKLYPPAKFPGWGATELFAAYLVADPAKGLALANGEAASARYPARAKLWKEAAGYAEALVTARTLLSQNKAAEARDLLAKVRQGESPADSLPSEPLALMRAEASQALGDYSGAYKVLLEDAAQHRTKRTDTALKAAGAKLGKDPEKVEAEVWDYRFAKAKPFKPFELTRFDNGEKITLGGLKGKVVLLDFFFPT